MLSHFTDKRGDKGAHPSCEGSYKKESYLTVTLFEDINNKLFHILDSSLPERKKCAGDTFLAQDYKMREHFVKGKIVKRFNQHAKAAIKKRELPFGNSL